MSTKRTEDEGQLATISENTPIKLGLWLATMGLVLAGIVTFTWKASALSTKMDTLTDLVARSIQGNNANESKLTQHVQDDTTHWTTIEGKVQAQDARLNMLDQTGTKALRDLTKDLNDLRNDFNVHDRLSKNGSKP